MALEALASKTEIKKHALHIYAPMLEIKNISVPSEFSDPVSLIPSLPVSAIIHLVTW